MDNFVFTLLGFSTDSINLPSISLCDITKKINNNLYNTTEFFDEERILFSLLQWSSSLSILCQTDSICRTEAHFPTIDERIVAFGNGRTQLTRLCKTELRLLRLCFVYSNQHVQYISHWLGAISMQPNMNHE